MSLIALPFLAMLFVQSPAPVSMEVLFDGVPVQGGGWVLTLTLVAEVDLTQTEIHVTHSEGLRIDAGQSDWNGPLNAETEVVLEIAYTLVDDPPQQIDINVTGRTRDGPSFQKRIERIIQNQEKKLECMSRGR